MKRGEVWLVWFDPTVGHEQAGKRPALVVSSDDFNDSRAGLVTVLPITGQSRRLPTRIRLRPPEGGVRQESWIIGEQIRTLSKERFVARWGLVSRETLSTSLEVVVGLLGLRCLEIDP